MGGDVVTPSIGEVVYSTPGTYSWTVPTGVTSVSVVCVSAGGGSPYSTHISGNGGGLGYGSYAVTPGEVIAIEVGASNPESTIGGQSSFGSHLVVTYNTRVGSAGGGSGGAGGYAGPGGAGGASSNDSPGLVGNGGGGGSDTTSASSGFGGGVGLYGVGANGVGGTNRGSGTAGSNGSGTNYGGGAAVSNQPGQSISGGPGAVRIIWGSGRSFPNNAA